MECDAAQAFITNLLWGFGGALACYLFLLGCVAFGLFDKKK